MNYYFVERKNTMDGSIDGFFWMKTEEPIYGVVAKLESDDEEFPAPYLPKVYTISEEQYERRPYSCAHDNQLSYEPNYGFLYQETDNNVFNAEFVVVSPDNSVGYAVFPNTWNGKYWDVTKCRLDGSLINESTARLYPVDVELDEDEWKRIGYRIK